MAAAFCVICIPPLNLCVRGIKFSACDQQTRVVTDLHPMSSNNTTNGDFIR